jgi:DNA-directed RNA polymerase specialized sigma24 family protein
MLQGLLQPPRKGLFMSHDNGSITRALRTSPEEVPTSDHSNTLNAYALPSGSPPTLEDICEHYYWYVFKRVLALTGDFHRAEELTQTTFEKVIRYYSRIKHFENIKAWLWITATRTVYDTTKTRGYQLSQLTCSTSTFLDEFGEEVEPAERGTSMEDVVADNELRMLAFQRLNPQARELLLRYHIYGEDIEHMMPVYDARRLLNAIYQRLLRGCEVSI